MSMDLARKTFSCEPEYFIAGTNIRIATAVKEAGADLSAGEFFADALVLPAGMTAADVEVPLRNLGIYLK